MVDLISISMRVSINKTFTDFYNKESIIKEEGIDDVTNQIVNNKRLKIKFYMKSCNFSSKDGQEELKYMDKIVMNYLTQMLPSTVITDIEYNFCNYGYDEC